MHFFDHVHVFINDFRMDLKLEQRPKIKFCVKFGKSKPKQQSLQRKSPQFPRPKKVKEIRSSTKSMLVVLSHIRGIMHREFGHSVQTTMRPLTVRWKRVRFSAAPTRSLLPTSYQQDLCWIHAGRFSAWCRCFWRGAGVLCVRFHFISSRRLRPLPQDGVQAEGSKLWHRGGDSACICKLKERTSRERFNFDNTTPIGNLPVCSQHDQSRNFKKVHSSDAENQAINLRIRCIN